VEPYGDGVEGVSQEGRTIVITGGGASDCTLTVQANVPSNGVVNESVKFTANVTKSGACDRTTEYKWTFGDGSSSTSASPSHTYKTLGGTPGP